MITDPSWLYSTIAQASAAIVAIVGGFITASVLMRGSEKASLTQQQANKKTRLRALEQEETRLYEVYETMKIDKFLEAIADELTKEDELPSLEVLMQRYPEQNLHPAILKREYENLSKLRLEARQFIEQHSDKINLAKFLLFDEWIKENELDISLYDYELLDEEYYRFRNREEEILEEQKRKTTPPQLRGMFEIQMPNIMRLPSPSQTQYELYRRSKEDRKFEDVERRVNNLRHEIMLLHNEITDLDTRLKTFTYPPNLGWGFLVLLLLAVFGILIPLLVIFAHAYTVTNSLIAIVSFILGLAAVFVYIYIQIRTLRR